MSETAKLRDDDYIDRLFSVNKGIRVPKNSGGYVTTYLTSGTKNITADGVYDVNEYASVNVMAGSVYNNLFLGLCDGSIAGDITAADLDGITELRAYIFATTPNLTSIEIPSGVVGIPVACFGATGATVIDLPSTIRVIQHNAFAWTDLQSLICRATTPPTLSANAFENADTLGMTIYVPSASVSAYQSAANWSAFASQIQAIP